MYELNCKNCAKFYLFKTQRPEICPRCSCLIDNNFKAKELNDYLFKSRSAVNSIIIKPTEGSFKDYKENQDLHIGCTDKNGNLIEFNENGLQIGTSEWSECFKICSADSLIEDCSISNSPTDFQNKDYLIESNSSGFFRKKDKDLKDNYLEDKDLKNKDSKDKKNIIFKNSFSLKNKETSCSKGSSSFERKEFIQINNLIDDMRIDNLKDACQTTSFIDNFLSDEFQKINYLKNSNLESSLVTNCLVDMNLKNKNSKDNFNLVLKPEANCLRVIDSARANWLANNKDNHFFTSKYKPNNEINYKINYKLNYDSIHPLSNKSGASKKFFVDYWNYIIEIIKNDNLIKQKFNSKTYDRFENNCLDFIFFFIQLLDLDQFENLTSKFQFCQQIIQPRIKELFKVIEFSRSHSNGFLTIEKKIKI